MKLDLGVGKASEKGWIGVDKIGFKGVKVVCDLGNEVWPWKDNSVDEVRSRYLINHLTPKERYHFFNELYRVMKKDATAHIVTPHWSADVAYGDLTAQWPPVAARFYFHLRKEWREENAPWDAGWTCDFDTNGALGMHPQLTTRNQEYQQQALTFWKEAAQELIAHLTKR